MSSSTSSSKMPWPGLIWALFFVLLLEFALRLAPDDAVLAIDQHDYAADDAMDYTAVNLAIEVFEPPDILILGDSRAREDVDVPLLRRELARRTGRRLEVRNYSAAAARADVCIALLDRLIAEDHLPRVLVLPWDAAMLRPLPPLRHRTRVAGLASLPREIARNGLPTEKEFADVLGNSIPLELALWRPTVRYRLRTMDLAGRLPAREGNAAFGGRTLWLRMSAGDATPLSLETRHIREDRIRRSARMFEVGERRAEFLRQLVQRARQHGVVVVLADIPPSPPLRRRPEVSAATDRFRALLAEIASADSGVLLFSSVSVEEDFGESDYLEQSHMTARGARRFTLLLAPDIAEAISVAEARAETNE